MAATVLALVRDLMLRSRIEGVAEALGVACTPAATLEIARVRAAEASPAVVFVDLSDRHFPSEETLAAMRAAASAARVVAFASHVDLKAFKAARAAGFDQVLSRSEFTARLPELLKT
jgi:DNA-binding NarL/FixJ family response regulator